MKNGENKNYKGYTIKKENGHRYLVGGFISIFTCYSDAKEAIDAAEAEDKALTEAEQYVQEVCGGWM